MRRFLLRLSAFLHRSRADREMSREIASHLVLMEDDFLRRGLSPAEARLAARRAYGGVEQTKELHRDARSFVWLEQLSQDLRHAFHSLAKSPGFVAVALLSLALGIGANTALFSLLNVMMFRTLPVRNPQELVEFVRKDGGSMMTNLPYAAYEHLSRDRETLSAAFGFYESSRVVKAGGPPENAKVQKVTDSFFPALGVPAMLGRAIGPDDARPDTAARVVTLSYGYWSRRFGRNPAIVGATIRLSGQPFTVIGVMPPEFFGVDRARLPDFWIPFELDHETDADWIWILGRLKPGISVLQARARLQPLFTQALESTRDDLKRRDYTETDIQRHISQRLLINSAAHGTSGLRWSYWEYSNTLKILFGLTGLVLLIACANLANLLLARSAARSREIGIRLVIGSTRWRLVRQLATENLLLSLGGGALGFLLAAGGHRLMLGFMIRDTNTVALDFHLDYRVLVFGMALSLATGLLFGLLPAFRATRADLAGAVHGVVRQGGPAHVPLARTLLSVQTALSMVMLFGAVLFARSLRNLGGSDLGLERNNLLLMDISSTARTDQERLAFWQKLRERVSALPGVHGMALAGDAVFGNGGWNQTLWIDHPGQEPLYARACMNWTDPGFFATAGIPVLLGREFGEQDRDGAPPVVLVNQTFARKYFGNANPVGRRFGDGGRNSSGHYEIVGVVGDAKYGDVRDPAPPMVFHPLLQEPPQDSYVLHLRTAGMPGPMGRSAARAVAAIDSDALVSDVKTVPEIVHRELREDRMVATLAGFFAALGLILGAVGIYGVASYRVARRTAEIGVRVALGARRADILWLVLQESVILLAVGLAIGLPAALASARLIKSMLFGLAPSDPFAIASAAAILFAAGALAGFLPARRAARIDPMEALRCD